MTHSVRPTVRTFYLLEPDGFRKDGGDDSVKLAFTFKDKFRRAAKAATGSCVFSRDRTRVFHRSAESRSVRHTIATTAAYEWQPSQHTGQFFSEQVKSAVDTAFVDCRDLLVFSVGNSHSLKSVLLHGKTATEGNRLRSVVDETVDYGLFHRTAKYLLEKLRDPSEKAGATFSMTATAVCVQMDHASDIIVPPPVKDPYNTNPSLDDILKEHNRLFRLVALARATTLEATAIKSPPRPVTSFNSGRDDDVLFQPKPFAPSSSSPTSTSTRPIVTTCPDQTEIPIRSIDDIDHVTNCVAAVDTHREAHLTSSAQSAPFYMITTLILRPNNEHQRQQQQQQRNAAKRRAANKNNKNNDSVNHPANNGDDDDADDDDGRHGGGHEDEDSSSIKTFRIRFVECADFDWSASAPEDTEHAQRISGSITATLCALSVWQREIATMRINESPTCRMIFSDLTLSRVTSLVFGTATYKAALPTMDFLARVRDAALWVALHGADGEEDDAVVDEELKAHITYVQQQCDDLRRQVVRLNASKELLAKSVDDEDQKIQQLQEQLSLLRRLTANNVRTREELIEIFDDRLEKEQRAKQKQELERAAEQESKFRAIRVGALERELDAIRHEDLQKDAALEAQIASISAETRRLISNAAVLEAEADGLAKKITEQDVKYEEIQRIHEADKQSKMSDMLDTRWAELEVRSRERLQAVRTAEVNARKRQQMVTLQNKAFTEAVNRPLPEPDAAALRAAKEKIRQLEIESAEVETTRKAIVHQLKRDAAHAQQEVSEAEAETRILAKYLHDITRCLWRFENTSGFVMDNLSQLPKLGLPVFDPLAPVDVEQLRRWCSRCRHWLQQNAGEQPPAVAFDVESARAEVLESGFSAWMEKLSKQIAVNRVAAAFEASDQKGGQQYVG